MCYINCKYSCKFFINVNSFNPGRKPYETELLLSACLIGGNQGAKGGNDWVKMTEAGFELEQSCSRVRVTTPCAVQPTE